jgi:hypothetical protein
MKSKIKKTLRRWKKKLAVGAAALYRLEKTNPKLRGAAAITALTVAATTANAQYYSSYNYGGNYNSSRDTTFQNQNTGGYTYGGPPMRSDNWFIRSIIYTLSGLHMMESGNDPYAPATRASGNGASPPRQQN